MVIAYSFSSMAFILALCLCGGCVIMSGSVRINAQGRFSHNRVYSWSAPVFVYFHTTRVLSFLFRVLYRGFVRIIFILRIKRGPCFCVFT